MPSAIIRREKSPAAPIPTITRPEITNVGSSPTESEKNPVPSTPPQHGRHHADARIEREETSLYGWVDMLLPRLWVHPRNGGQCQRLGGTLPLFPLLMPRSCRYTTKPSTLLVRH